MVAGSIPAEWKSSFTAKKNEHIIQPKKKELV